MFKLPLNSKKKKNGVEKNKYYLFRKISQNVTNVTNTVEKYCEEKV